MSRRGWHEFVIGSDNPRTVLFDADELVRVELDAASSITLPDGSKQTWRSTHVHFRNGSSTSVNDPNGDFYKKVVGLIGLRIPLP